MSNPQIPPNPDAQIEPTLSASPAEVPQDKDLQLIQDKVHEEVNAAESPEKALLSGAKKLAERIVSKFPQTNDEGNLNYYFAGSMAVMLLIQSATFDETDEKKLPEIQKTATVEIPAESKQDLQRFIRKIGDIDFVRLEEYKKVPQAQRLGKGGGSIFINDLSHAEKNVTTIEKNQESLMMDPVGDGKNGRAISVNLDGETLYISHPIDILSYKIIHLGESFETNGKSEKFVKDFESMFHALEKMYPRQQLVQEAYDKLMEYTSFSPNGIFIPYHNKGFTPELRAFFDDMLKCDPNYEYLEKMNYGKERSFGVLKILERIKSPEAKNDLIAFMNSHQTYIDQWSANTSSAHNRKIVAEYVMDHEELFPELDGSTLDFEFKKREGKKDAATLEDIFKTHTGLLRDMAKKIPADAGMEMLPDKPYLMTILAKVHEEDLKPEFEAISALLDTDASQFKILRIFEAKIMQEPDKRAIILEACHKAAKLTNEKKSDIVLSKIASSLEEKAYDYESKQWVTFTSDQQLQKMFEVIKQTEEEKEEPDED